MDYVTDVKSDTIDSDKLQNAIDMALSDAYDLVSSWMETPNPSNAAEEARRLAEEREFEEFARRPPRLGVGTSLPSSTTIASARRDLQLAKKLLGKKRERGEGVAHPSLARNQTGAGPNSDDDNEESRTSVSSKRAKVLYNPFETKKKKKKSPQGLANADLRRTNSGTPDEISTDSQKINSPSQFEFSSTSFNSSGKEPSTVFMPHVEMLATAPSSGAQILRDDSTITSSRTSNSSSERTASPSSSLLSPSRSPLMSPTNLRLPLTARAQEDQRLLNLTPIPDVVDGNNTLSETKRKKRWKKKKKKARNAEMNG